MLAHMVQEAAREREIEERERKLGALMAEKGATTQKKKTSKVYVWLCGARSCPTSVALINHKSVNHPAV